MSSQRPQLISYIAPGAPATRRPATGDEPFLRPEIGFTPNWYRTHLGIDFGERYHTDPAYRRESLLAMRAEIRKRFPGTRVGRADEGDSPLDMLTGTYGANVISSIYGVPILYSDNNWPNCEHQYLSGKEVDRLEPPDLDTNPFFQGLLEQVDWIAENEGRVEGFINWQGVLNNSHRLRGETLFMDLMTNPDRCNRLFSAVCDTMIEGCKRLHERQRESGVEVGFFTISNCLVNMVSPKTYKEQLLPHDRRIAEEFDHVGVHNCAWKADPYIENYASIPGLSYIDMGLMSDLARARTAFPDGRRALMYTPMDVANKSLEEITADLEKTANDYGPCDVVAADIEADVPDARVQEFIDLCAKIGDRVAG